GVDGAADLGGLTRCLRRRRGLLLHSLLMWWLEYPFGEWTSGETSTSLRRWGLCVDNAPETSDAALVQEALARQQRKVVRSRPRRFSCARLSHRAHLKAPRTRSASS